MCANFVKVAVHKLQGLRYFVSPASRESNLEQDMLAQNLLTEAVGRGLPYLNPWFPCGMGASLYTCKLNTFQKKPRMTFGEFVSFWKIGALLSLVFLELKKSSLHGAAFFLSL